MKDSLDNLWKHYNSYCQVYAEIWGSLMEFLSIKTFKERVATKPVTVNLNSEPVYMHFPVT